jgi:hypothetical protein
VLLSLTQWWRFLPIPVVWRYTWLPVWYHPSILRWALMRESIAGYPTLLSKSLLWTVAFTTELAYHRLDVGKCPISGFLTLLSFLNLPNLNTNMFSSLLCHFLHVPFDKLNLCVQVRVPLVRVLKFFFQFEVPHLELVNRTLVLFFSFLHSDVWLGELTELMLELSELLVKLIHGILVCSPVVIKLSL